MSDNFLIPIVIFIFKRKNTLSKIVDVLRQVKPAKVYIIADGPRNMDEIDDVNECRKEIEKLINWDCSIIKNYASSNRGVYKNIGEGAKWVFNLEKEAIFLEDDNLPHVSFFKYCELLLQKYVSEEKVLWINGTNYLGDYDSPYSYVFTQHLLPCGWASWSNKFLKYYDGNLDLMEYNDNLKMIKYSYVKKSLFRQQRYLLRLEKKRIVTGKDPISWDYQMDFSLKFHNLYGISPRVNLINNIGVDNFSIHGGNSIENVMTSRFCGIKEKEIIFPLIHPSKVQIDSDYEKKIGKILLYPIITRVRIFIVSRVKKILRNVKIMRD